jgi:hypothetical protein
METKMARSKSKDEHKEITYPAIPPWQRSPGLFIAGQEEVTEVDIVAHEMERKWGVDRLRLLVDKDLREKFDRQRYLFSQAIWCGELEDVRLQSRRMAKAWQALDRAAMDAGKGQAAPEVWEVALSNGRAVAILRDWQDAAVFEAQRSDRSAQVYTLEEIARLIEGFPEVIRAKAMFAGSEVTRTKGPERDPLRGIEAFAPIDDEIPF